MQQQAIVPIIHGRNVILKAQSGTGRMLTFVIAALQKVDPKNRECQIVVLTPNRGITVEMWRLLRDLGRPLGVISQTCLEDGDGIDVEEVSQFVCGGESTTTSPHVIVGTSVKVLGHIQAGDLETSSVGLLMFADFDTLLAKQLEYTLKCIFNAVRPSNSQSDPKLQVVLYFDLQTPELLHIADQLTQQQQTDEVVKIFIRKVPIHLHHVRHYYLDVDREEWKLETLCDLYEMMCVPQLVVFCNTREKLEWLAHALQSPTSPLNNGSPTEVAVMHADQSAQERATVMQSFRRGSNIRFLIIATPLVLEHVDIAQLALVVAYDLPLDQEVYLRRCGRGTLRMRQYWQRPVCVSFVRGQEEMGLLKSIESGIGSEILEMPMNLVDYL